MSVDAPWLAQILQLQALEHQTSALVSIGKIDEAAPLFQQRVQLLRVLVDAALKLSEDARAESLTQLRQYWAHLEVDIQPLAANLQQVREELSQLGKSSKAANAYGETKTLRT